MYIEIEVRETKDSTDPTIMTIEMDGDDGTIRMSGANPLLGMEAMNVIAEIVENADVTGVRVNGVDKTEDFLSQ